jgi:thermitase
LRKVYRLLGEVMGVYQSTSWHPNLNVAAINMSYGGPHFDTSEAIALYYCLSTKAVCVASAGNDGTTNPSYPAAIGYRLGVSPDYVIGVAGYMYDGTIMPGSNYGTWNADLSAPGQNVLTVDMYGQDRREFSGTSAAAPFVSALALLKKSKSSFMSARFIHNKILQYKKLTPPMHGVPTPPPSVSYFLVMGGY